MQQRDSLRDGLKAGESHRASPASGLGLGFKPVGREAGENHPAIGVGFVEAKDVPVRDRQVGVGRRTFVQDPRHRPGAAVVAAEPDRQVRPRIGIAGVGQDDAALVEPDEAALA